MSITIVNTLPDNIWRGFVDAHPSGTIFHTPEMFEVFARAEQHRPMLWAAVNDKGEPLVLFLPVEITLMDGVFRGLTTRAVSYGGILCSPGGEALEALELLLQNYVREVRNGILFTEIRNLSDATPLQPTLARCGFRYAEHLNYLISLNRTLEEIGDGFSRRLRQTIRQGLKRQKVVVEPATDRHQVDICYRLVQKTYARARVPLPDHSLIEAAFDVLSSKQMMRTCLARVGEEYVGGSIELLYKDVVYAWYCGMDRRYASWASGELIVWDILAWGVKNGFKTYDFGGGGKPGEEYGVRDFKAKFRGDQVCFGRNAFVHAPVKLQLSELGYRLYRLFHQVYTPNGSTDRSGRRRRVVPQIYDS